jgi:hypothetical protein
MSALLERLLKASPRVIINIVRDDSTDPATLTYTVNPENSRRDELISYIRVKPRPGFVHADITMWNRGGNVGTIVMSAEDTGPFVARLLGVEPSDLVADKPHKSIEVWPYWTIPARLGAITLGQPVGAPVGYSAEEVDRALTRVVREHKV